MIKTFFIFMTSGLIGTAAWAQSSDWTLAHLWEGEPYSVIENGETIKKGVAGSDGAVTLPMAPTGEHNRYVIRLVNDLEWAVWVDKDGHKQAAKLYQSTESAHSESCGPRSGSDQPCTGEPFLEIELYGLGSLIFPGTPYVVRDEHGQKTEGTLDQKARLAFRFKANQAQSLDVVFCQAIDLHVQITAQNQVTATWPQGISATQLKPCVAAEALQAYLAKEHRFNDGLPYAYAAIRWGDTPQETRREEQRVQAAEQTQAIQEQQDYDRWANTLPVSIAPSPPTICPDLLVGSFGLPVKPRVQFWDLLLQEWVGRAVMAGQPFNRITHDNNAASNELRWTGLISGRSALVPWVENKKVASEDGFGAFFGARCELKTSDSSSLYAVDLSQKTDAELADLAEFLGRIWRIKPSLKHLRHIRYFLVVNYGSIGVVTVPLTIPLERYDSNLPTK